MTVSRKRSSALLAGIGASLLAVLSGPPIARAQDADRSAEQCMASAVVALESRGAEAIGEPAVGFLHQGRDFVTPIVLPEDGCVGVLAVGHRRVLDLDLVLFTDGGIQVAQDVNLDAHPYLRYCGRPGLRLFAQLRMYKGIGEVRLQSFRSPPATLPDLNRLVGGCFAEAAGLRTTEPELGDDPSQATSFTNIEEELRPLGYLAVGGEIAGVLGERERTVHRPPVERNVCYGFAVVGGVGVRDVDLLVRDHTGEELGRDESRGATALVRACSRVAARVELEVRMFDGAGDYGVRIFRLRESDEPRPTGVEGFARITYAEAQAVLRRRGLVGRELAWGYASPGSVLTIPFRVQAGQCYGVTAVMSDELRGADLDLIVTDPQDARVGWDLGNRQPMVVYHCAREDAELRVASRVYAGRGRFLVLIGEEAP
ncbi:MAG: hypothetical protein AAGF12_30370 [Myxococcota bacterium]